MKITKVDVMQVKTPNPSWRPILCRVYTDEGIYGDGEAALAYGIAAPAAFGMIRDLAALIIGMDPLDNEVVWDTLYKTPSGDRTAVLWCLPESAPLTLRSGIYGASFSTCRYTSC